MSIIFKIKTVVIGESDSGKSSVVSRLIYNKFNEFGNATIGAQFLSKEIGKNNKLEIWDTAGQERYRALIPMYIRNAQIIFLVISLEKNREETEYEKQYWLNYLTLHNNMSKFCKKILLYNKSDLYTDFEVENDERFDRIFVVSCKNNTGIDKLLDSLESIVSIIKDELAENVEFSIPIPKQKNIDMSQKKGLLDYSYSVGEKIMKCSIL